MIKEIETRIKNLKEFANRNSIKLYISLSSSLENSDKPFFGGIRVTSYFVIVSFINVSQKNLEDLHNVINLFADKIFVDVEKKHPFYLKEYNYSNDDEPLYSNLISASYKKFKYEKIVPWSPSRLTADSTVSLIRHIRLRFHHHVVELIHKPILVSIFLVIF